MRGLLMVLTVLSLTTPPLFASAPSDEVEAGLLSILGLRRRPRPNQRVYIPPIMLDLYRQHTGQEVDTTNLPLPGRFTRNANTVRSITHTGSAIDSRFPRANKFRLHFDISSVPESETLTAAEVKLKVLPAANTSSPHSVLVYDIVRPGIKGKTPPILHLIDFIEVDSSEELMVDILKAVIRWRVEPNQNHGLLIKVEGVEENRVRLRRSLDENEEVWSEQQPLLFIFSKDSMYKEPTLKEILSRRKRATSTTQTKKQKRKDPREICHRSRLYVDFGDVGWNDWIVAPPGYEAYFCEGDCPFPMADHLNSTNHAVVQTLVNSVSPNSVPKACCVPTSLSSISMLYLDEDSKVVLKNYQDMTVNGCGCR